MKRRAILLHKDHPALIRARRKHLAWGGREKAIYASHRGRVEGVHGEAKTWHGLARVVRRGIGPMQIQAYLTATVINLRRLAAALPGVRLIEVLDEWTFRVWTPVGATVFLLMLRVVEEREPAYVRITGGGRGGGQAVGLSIEIDLLPGEQGTTVAWAGDVHVDSPLDSAQLSEL